MARVQTPLPPIKIFFFNIPCWVYYYDYLLIIEWESDVISRLFQRTATGSQKMGVEASGEESSSEIKCGRLE